MHIYCITHKQLDFIEKLNLIPAGVGDVFYPTNYINDKDGDNISHKNPYYGEITFHYWLWKNKLNHFNKKDWFGICHYRRFFIKDEFGEKIQNSNNKQGYLDNLISLEKLKAMLIQNPIQDWNKFDVILCEPINLKNQKKMKIIKRGFKCFLKNPSILFNQNKHNIRLQFEMFHGYGNLDLAINFLPDKDKSDFIEYVNNKTTLSPNCMYMSNNPELVEEFYKSLFIWLKKCESVFGFKNTNEYGTQRIYTFLTERYLPFWFEKYSKVKYLPWLFYDLSK